MLVANAIAHIISFQKLRKAKAPNSAGVMAFVFINAIIAILLLQNVDWAKWLALIFPSLGGFGLLITTIIKGKGTWIDYIILLLDSTIVGLSLNYHIL
ncbi:hypothetical protein [Flammeovirga sp. OC4]|uniref:hypothetical protein n=1 Tax=Flammeovirga sp. OC4 TaxID=1382345 RepID=UPI0005C59135|nr:hypothetical protein [Flammeovirga sp. OC4]